MASCDNTKIKGTDVPIVNLIPIRKRTISKKNYDKLLANIKTVGLIEPLCICQERNQYYILDGYIRYTVMLELGIETVPCLILPSRDLYTPNRQVNHLSRQQEIKMLRKAIEKLDETTIAKAFGMDSIKESLKTNFYDDLHPSIVRALKDGLIKRSVASELKYVLPERQKEIFLLMEDGKDYSLSFVKAQVLETHTAYRNKKKRNRIPWLRGQNTKNDLAKKLEEAEKHYDFYQVTYRQYVTDLLRLVIYVRQILDQQELCEYLAAHYPQDLEFFQSVLAENEVNGSEKINGIATT